MSHDIMFKICMRNRVRAHIMGYRLYMPGFGNHFSTEAAGYEGKVLPVGQNNPQKASVLWRFKHVGSTQQRHMLYVHAPGRFRLVCRTIERDRIYSATQSQQAKVAAPAICVCCKEAETFVPNFRESHMH